MSDKGSGSSSRPDSPCRVIATFSLDGSKCEILAFHDQKEALLKKDETERRAREANASGTDADLARFWNGRDSVPLGHSGYFFLFPEAKDAAGRMRYVSRRGGSWGIGSLEPNAGSDEQCVFVRFAKLD